MHINVKNGTRAGWRRIVAKAQDWKCANCGARNRYFWVRCPVCSHPRDAD